jgi:hypothetical protein
MEFNLQERIPSFEFTPTKIFNRISPERELVYTVERNDLHSAQLYLDTGANYFQAFKRAAELGRVNFIELFMIKQKEQLEEIKRTAQNKGQDEVVEFIREYERNECINNIREFQLYNYEDYTDYGIHEDYGNYKRHKTLENDELHSIVVHNQDEFQTFSPSDYTNLPDSPDPFDPFGLRESSQHSHHKSPRRSRSFSDSSYCPRCLEPSIEYASEEKSLFN